MAEQADTDPTDHIPDDVLNLLAEAQELYDSDTDAAQAKLDEAIELNDSIAETYFIYANLSREKMNDKQKARECYEKAVEINPEFYKAHYNLAILLKTEFEDSENASVCYMKALEINPDSVEAHFNLAAIQMEKKEYDEAKGHYTKVLELDATYFRAEFQLGNVALFGENNLDEAKARFEKTIELNPEYMRALFMLGQVLGKQGETAAAVETLKKAVDGGYQKAQKILDFYEKKLARQEKQKEAEAKEDAPAEGEEAIEKKDTPVVEEEAAAEEEAPADE